MTEYIEREAAIDAIMKVYVRTAGYKARERVFEAKEAVHRLPVADVAPVVHGRWIRIGDDAWAECSECGDCYSSCDNGGTPEFMLFCDLYKYCPSCGARMDGGAGNETD